MQLTQTGENWIVAVRIDIVGPALERDARNTIHDAIGWPRAVDNDVAAFAEREEARGVQIVDVGGFPVASEMIRDEALALCGIATAYAQLAHPPRGQPTGESLSHCAVATHDTDPRKLGHG